MDGVCERQMERNWTTEENTRGEGVIKDLGGGRRKKVERRGESQLVQGSRREAGGRAKHEECRVYTSQEQMGERIGQAESWQGEREHAGSPGEQ